MATHLKVHACSTFYNRTFNSSILCFIRRRISLYLKVYHLFMILIRMNTSVLSRRIYYRVLTSLLREESDALPRIDNVEVYRDTRPTTD